MREAFEHDIEGSKRKREPGVPIGVRHICKYMQNGSQTFYKLHTHTMISRPPGFPMVVVYVPNLD